MITIPRNPLRILVCTGVMLFAGTHCPAAFSDPAPQTLLPAPISSPIAPGTKPTDQPVTPTDQPPSEFLPPSPVTIGRTDLVRGALDTRYRMSDTGRRYGIWVNNVELDYEHRIVSKGQVNGNFVLRVLAEDPPDVPNSREVQIGETYLLYKLPIQTETSSTVYIKVGQFQIPFALLAVYDPHQEIIQPLYAQSLGLRTDWGLAVTGQFYGYLNYDFSVTAGSGPDHIDINASRVVSFRLGRTFTTRNGVVNVGGSLLTGRLPDTDIDSDDPFAVELPPSGRIRPYRGMGFVNKSRIAGDGTYVFKGNTLRGEAMSGADGDKRVLGYYVEGEHLFSRRAGVILAHSMWIYPVGNSTSERDSIGLSYSPGVNVTTHLVYEYLRDVPRDLGGNIRHRLTAQVLLRF